MKIGTRLRLGFGTLVVMTLLLSLLGIEALSSVVKDFQAVSSEIWPKTKLANANIKEAYDYARAFSFIITSEGRPGVSPADIAAARDVLAVTVKNVNENMKALEGIVSGEQEKSLLDQVKEARANYGKSRNRVLGLQKAGKKDEAIVLMFSETTKLQSAYIDAWKKFISYEEDLLKSGNEEANATYGTGKLRLLGLSLLAVLVGIVVSTANTRVILRLLGGELHAAIESVGALANGNLSQRIAASSPESLLGHLELMRQSLNAMLKQLLDNSANLERLSHELVDVSENVANGSDVGSDAAASMAGAVEEMTVSISVVSQNSRNASATAVQTGQSATQGVERMHELGHSMASISANVRDSAVQVGELGKQSEAIRSIVGVIKDIADQTNLLALNASIEAARAGESGRGFAVVADEVRKLAERTAQSTKDISQVIESIQGNVQNVVSTMSRSVEAVENGERQAEQSAEAISHIQRETNGMVSTIHEISSAMSENSSASHQIANTVESIARSAEMNSDAAKQMAGAAQQLETLANQLNLLTTRFTVA
ncbi:methyl-accepting chemotaxis protein [Chromobacterium sp. ATCC 53434]|nr:methyl-accepting chemotaxis protein [Chromobacterium sp. ATCC 53434]